MPWLVCPSRVLTSSVYGSPIPDSRVWVTADEGGNTPLACSCMDANGQNGQVNFYLDFGAVLTALRARRSTTANHWFPSHGTPVL